MEGGSEAGSEAGKEAVRQGVRQAGRQGGKAWREAGRRGREEGRESSEGQTAAQKNVGPANAKVRAHAHMRTSAAGPGARLDSASSSRGTIAAGPNVRVTYFENHLGTRRSAPAPPTDSCRRQLRRSVGRATRRGGVERRGGDQRAVLRATRRCLWHTFARASEHTRRAERGELRCIPGTRETWVTMLLHATETMIRFRPWSSALGFAAHGPQVVVHTR